METLILITAAIVIFGLQLTLCLEVKNTLVKLIPTFIMAVASVYFFIMVRLATSWDALGYALLSVISVAALIDIAIAWIISAVVRLIKHRRENR